jgi:hypothetical protein
MAQGVLPFKYEAEKNRSGMSALAGLPTYLDLASVCGLQASIDRHWGCGGSPRVGAMRRCSCRSSCSISPAATVWTTSSAAQHVLGRA